MAASGGNGELLSARGAAIEFHSAGSGARLLTLHGAKDLKGWHPYHERLSAHYEILAPVHPGFGRSERPSGIETVDDLAYFYLDLIDDRGWAPVHLIGIGFGGWIAAEMAVRSCATMRSLVLADAVGIRLSDPATPDITDVYAMSDDERMRRLWRDPEHGRALLGDPRTMPEDLLETYLRNEESETLFTWKPYMHNPALKRRLHRIKVPALVVWGEDDGVVSTAYGRAYAEAMPDARFCTIAGAAHLPHLERPDAFSAAVHEFIAGLAS